VEDGVADAVAGADAGRTAPGAVPRVVVGLPTFRRPDGLRRILPPLIEQVRALSVAQARVVVVDNDPAGSAEPVVAALVGPSDPVRYVHEPRPGIAAARNAALDAAGDADALVFVDDDELPDPGWLHALVSTWVTWGCAAVSGPMTFVFEGPVDDWVRATGVFEWAARTTGSVSPGGGGSGNLLLDLRFLRAAGIRFDEDFGLSGGSDTMLMHTLRSKGGEVRWCQEAGVVEFVPPARTDRGWLLRRTVRTSNTWSRVQVLLARAAGRRLRVRFELTARGCYRVVRGSLLRARGRLRRRTEDDARGAMDVASGVGILLGAFGVVRYEYRRAAEPVTAPAPR
jgi:glycosyltransferase involved in cell wall biosynthesis